MPADFFIDTQRRVVFSKGTDALGRAEVLDHMDRLQSHPDFHPEFNQLCDFRQIKTIALSHEDVMELARRTIFRVPSRRAFVVSGDLQYGTGRVFAAYRELAGEPGIVVFREMDKALSWLSLPAEPDPKLFTRLNSVIPNPSGRSGEFLFLEATMPEEDEG